MVWWWSCERRDAGGASHLRLRPRHRQPRRPHRHLARVRHDPQPGRTQRPAAAVAPPHSIRSTHPRGDRYRRAPRRADDRPSRAPCTHSPCSRAYYIQNIPCYSSRVHLGGGARPRTSGSLSLRRVSPVSALTYTPVHTHVALMRGVSHARGGIGRRGVSTRAHIVPPPLSPLSLSLMSPLHTRKMFSVICHPRERPGWRG